MLVKKLTTKKRQMLCIYFFLVNLLPSTTNTDNKLTSPGVMKGKCVQSCRKVAASCIRKNI